MIEQIISTFHHYHDNLLVFFSTTHKTVCSYPWLIVSWLLPLPSRKCSPMGVGFRFTWSLLRPQSSEQCYAKCFIDICLVNKIIVNSLRSSMLS